MKDDYVKHKLERTLNVSRIITLFYMPLPKDFLYGGEAHDFWEMVYVDKGEMLCTADTRQFILKSGEMTFHRPNEFHNLSGDNRDDANVSIITFECKSPAMSAFSGKIFKLNADERATLAELFSEGISCFSLVNEEDPLSQTMYKRESIPTGAQQLTKNLLEIFLIKLMRHTDVITKEMRESYLIGGINAPAEIKAIIDLIEQKIYARLTVAEVALHLGRSESAVKQMFHEYVGGGIIAYYNRRKIKEARRLIRAGNHNMTEISEMLGFDTPQYFTKCFKTIMKMTPSQYKKSILT